ncbi:MAG: SCE4755 family polysaccharide monooxygenase-like protein [Myxococcota bacterium]
MLLTIVAALAHTALEYPQPRYPSDGNSANKACPCGVGESNRLCNVPSDRSDPDRDDSRATTFQAGQTITLEFYETIGHAGRYRIAFDPDGADMDDFNANILLDVADPPGNAGNTGEGSRWAFEVTLPSTPCTNCTLQLVQMMDGNTADPVADPIGRSSYYQCADLVLTAGPVDTDDPAPPIDTDDTDADTDPDTDTDAPPVEADAGCGCASVTPLSSGVSGLVLAGLVCLRRKRT